MSLTNRDGLESNFARALAKLSRKQLAEMKQQLGDPPDWRNVSKEYWDTYAEQLREIITAQVADAYDVSARDLGQPYQAQADINWNQVNTEARDWAKDYTFDLVKGITETTQTSLRDAISAAIDRSAPLSEITAQIEPLFGPARAEMIAVTELTRAASEGEKGMVARLADTGIDLRATWNTAEDEHVCPICGSLDGQQADGDGNFNDDEGNSYDGPPAHPRCRCGLGWSIGNGND